MSFDEILGGLNVVVEGSSEDELLAGVSEVGEGSETVSVFLLDVEQYDGITSLLTTTMILNCCIIALLMVRMITGWFHGNRG